VTRTIAWTGTKSRYTEQSDGTMELDYKHENQREIPIWIGNKAGYIKVVGTESGLSREYQFGTGSGPESFIQEMDDADAAKLLALPGDGENFQDVTGDDGFFDRFYRPLDEIFANG